MGFVFLSSICIDIKSSSREMTSKSSDDPSGNPIQASESLGVADIDPGTGQEASFFWQDRLGLEEDDETYSYLDLIERLRKFNIPKTPERKKLPYPTLSLFFLAPNP